MAKLTTMTNLSWAWRIFKLYALENGDFDDSKMVNITKIEQTYRQEKNGESGKNSPKVCRKFK